ncbi:MAG: ATP-binding protein [Syntrophales bacterium]|nr:ATP-binding protein [Syntrophales bacterium]
MFLSLLNRAKRNLSLRLTLWYTTVSLFAFIAIFTIAYYALMSSLKKEDEKAIVVRLNKYKAFYNDNGLEGVQSAIALERIAEKPGLFFLRIADKGNHTLLLSLPDQWNRIDITELSRININMEIQQISPKNKGNETIYEIMTFPLQDGNFIQIGKDINYREEILNRFKKVSFVVMLPAILMGLLGGYLVTYRTLLPIRNLTKTIKSIANTGETGARVPIGKTDDELGELVSLFNHMIMRIEHLIEGMKASLDNVAHELRTPITRLRVLAESALASNNTIESCREALSDCMEESERIMMMLNTLMDIAEANAGTLKLNRERVNISALIEEVVAVYLYLAEEKQIKIHADLSEEIIILADPSRIKQAIGNLIDNSIKYSNTGGVISIKAQKKTPKEAIIEIKDTGIGISEKDLPKIWERLYRGDQSRSQRGLGLGLSVVKSIVDIHGGHIEVLSRPLDGSTFLVYLPLKE